MDLGETARLFRAALVGDNEAHAELLERIRPRIVLWVAARMSVTLRARVDAEDIAQDILADIHSGLARFQEEDAEHFFRWIFRVAENRIADAARYHGAGKRRPDRTPPRPQTTPSVAAARREDAELLRRAVAGLDEAHRDVLRLRRLEERPYEEVAQILEIPEAVARVRYFRALKALRRALLGQGTIRDS